MTAWGAWWGDRLRAGMRSIELRFFRHAERREIQGVFVAVSSHGADEVFERIDAAFNLLRFHGTRTLVGLRKDTDGVWVWSTSGGRAEWRSDLRLVVLDETYVRNPQTSPRDIAATLVHEATHARLARMGFQYTVERRERIERACFRRQLAFARRLPGADQLIAKAESQLARASDWLTPGAFRIRKLEKPASTSRSSASSASRDYS